MGTDSLFENHTVKEIQEIEKKLRNDIECKKEELRQMVGERYRDLMEAADTITEMKEIAESVTNCVKSIENGCNILQRSSLRNGILGAIEGVVENEKKKNRLLYIIASQIKILMDSPTKIWCFIQKRDFVNAVSLFLLARHTHSLLVMDPVYREHNVPNLFPVINRQWMSISSFRHSLLQNCQLVLETQKTEPEEALGPLCCSCLLSNTSIQHTLSEVLNIRKNVLKSIFRPEKYAKEQISEFVTVVQITLKNVYVLFCPDSQSNIDQDCRTNLLHQELSKIVSKDGQGPVSLLDSKSSDIFQFLPEAVTDFRPILATQPETCNLELLYSKCTEWIEDIRVTLQPELKNVLNFVSSVQNLSFIKETVFEQVSEVREWERMCDVLLKKPFSIWDFFLKNCFLQRIEDIINEQLKSASEMCQKDIEESLYRIGIEGDDEFCFEKNVSAYIWSESPGDVPNNVAWNSRHHRDFWNSGTLSMKAMGFTPKIQSVCKDLDSRLQDILEDTAHFSYFQHHMTGDASHDKLQRLASHTNKTVGSASDNAEWQLLGNAAEKQFTDLVKYMEATISYLEQEKISSGNSDRIVLLGHLCNGLAHLCPHINSCLLGYKLSEIVDRCKRQGTRITFISNFTKENELWKDLKKKLLNLSASAFRLWSVSQIDEVRQRVDRELITNSAEGLLKSLLQWDKVEIQEESEQGHAVKSVLRIPQHVSTPVTNALFSFCCKLNTIGGFALHSDVRASISMKLLTHLLSIYKSKIDGEIDLSNSHIVQVQSLQLLFDVQFLIGLVKGQEKPELTILADHIVNKAVSRIDPFDMDVFATPLQQNVKRALQKSLALFGLIASPEQVSYLSSTRSQSLSSSADPNIMLTSNSGIGRFPLLPLPTKTSGSALQDQFAATSRESDPKQILHHSHSSSPNLSAASDNTFSNNSLKSTASFYERVTAMSSSLSSSWFGN